MSNLKKFEIVLLFMIFGSFWFTPLLTSSNDLDTETPSFFLGTYLYLPGIVLPSIVLFSLKGQMRSIFLYYVPLVWLIYFASAWIFSMESSWSGSPYLASFTGAFLFIAVTNKIIVKRIVLGSAVLCAMLSTLGFIFYDIFDKMGFSIACFLWTCIVGFTLQFTLSKFTATAT
jgi:hypothetical protein